MRILSIGNSFSRDAHRYLHAIAQSAGKELETVNLYIGGCPLERHWANIERDEAAYGEDLNGEETGRTLSVAQALREGPWDAVTLQQASHDSGWKDTYEPFLTQILAFLRENAPGVPVWMHQTWAYEDDSTHAAFARYHRNRAGMTVSLTDPETGEVLATATLAQKELTDGGMSRFAMPVETEPGKVYNIRITTDGTAPEGRKSGLLIARYSGGADEQTAAYVNGERQGFNWAVRTEYAEE